jgi:Flagellar hook-length control protein FliK
MNGPGPLPANIRSPNGDGRPQALRKQEPKADEHEFSSAVAKCRSSSRKTEQAMHGSDGDKHCDRCLPQLEHRPAEGILATALMSTVHAMLIVDNNVDQTDLVEPSWKKSPDEAGADRRDRLFPIGGLLGVGNNSPVFRASGDDLSRLQPTFLAAEVQENRTSIQVRVFANAAHVGVEKAEKDSEDANEPFGHQDFSNEWSCSKNKSMSISKRDDRSDPVRVGTHNSTEGVGLTVDHSLLELSKGGNSIPPAARQILDHLRAPVQELLEQEQRTGTPGSTRRLTLRLHPDHMGDVQVTLQIREGALSVVIEAQRAETAQLLRHDQDILTNLMRSVSGESGLSSLQISVQEFQQRRDNTTNAAAEPMGSFGSQSSNSGESHASDRRDGSFPGKPDALAVAPLRSRSNDEESDLGIGRPGVVVV